jgi:tetratricopeptide (TPR) repeat protein
LLKSRPSNPLYFQKTIDCNQQLQRYDVCEKLILDRIQKYNQASLLVDLGYNFQLLKNDAKAKKQYDLAIDRIKKNPTDVYGVASVFEKKVVLDYAILAYQTAMTIDPKLNFNYQMAILYGQKGNTDLMIEKFLSESFSNPQMLNVIHSQFLRFISEDLNAVFSDKLRKALLLRAQKNQDVFWNQYLSWFFVQQKEFGKAFMQEKGIYKRNPETFSNIVNLAKLAIEEDEPETAQEIFIFILENTNDLDLKIEANRFLMKIKVANATEKDLPSIGLEFDNLIKEFGFSPYTLSILKLQAHFVAFNLKNPEEAKTILKKVLELPLNQYQIADIKMELGDILLSQEKFNLALILYSQVEEDQKNDEVGHEASLKIAKTSYYQNDFVWASKQLKALKSATTQLIANDAMDLFLLLNDNTVADSTQVSLKKFAKADFLLYQNKTTDALTAFQNVLKENKTPDSRVSLEQAQQIEPITYYRIGKIYEKQGDFISALIQYQKIIDNYKECIYVDEANYFAAEIYNKQIKDTEKAKKYYEEIIFKHEDSIYFTDARRKYRALRGDKDL